jgi:hypothetical protein
MAKIVNNEERLFQQSHMQTEVEMDIPSSPPAKPHHTGGGWYEMPDGSRVKGKAAAGL